jgi:MFS family permease
VTRDFYLGVGVNFLLYFVFYILIATIAPYTSYVLKTSTAISGLASGIFVIGILFGRLFAGRRTLRTSAKKILIFGGILYFIFSTLYVPAKEPFYLILVRFFHGLSFGIAHNACGTIVAKTLPPRRRGEGIAYYSMGQIVSAALGPFVGMMFLKERNFEMIFLSATIVSLFSLFLSLKISDEEEKREVLETPLKRYIESNAVPVSLVILIAGLSYSSVLTFVSMYGVSLRLEEITGYFFLVYALFVILTRPISGRLLDRVGAGRVIHPCLLIFSSGMLLLGNTISPFFLLLSAALLGLGYGNLLSLGQAEAVKSVPDERIGLATSTYFIFLDVGAGFGPYIAGMLVPFLGYPGLYTLMAFLTLSASPVYYFLKRQILRE